MILKDKEFWDGWHKRQKARIAKEIKQFPHSCFLPWRGSIDEQREPINWCREHLAPYTWMDSPEINGDVLYRFTNREDMMRFLLIFGGKQ